MDQWEAAMWQALSLNFLKSWHGPIKAIHTLSLSTTFSNEPRKFREVRSQKFNVLFIRFHLIYIDYVLRTFGKIRFMRSNCQFEHCLDLHIGLIGGRNWKLRPPLTRFDATNLVVVSEFRNDLMFENAFFDVSSLHCFAWNFTLWTSRTSF